MEEMIITGDISIAYGALLSGVAVVTGYPGSPSSNTIDYLAGLAQDHGLHVEWSTNEKVAFETAVGASIGGVPALMGCKGVGFNVALDPIMVANLTDVGVGLVILLGDDPGAWASQNDQDTRPIAWGTELPMLEPATPAEGIAMTQSAFQISKDHQIPVIIRITKSFGALEDSVNLPNLPMNARIDPHPFERHPMRWISVPKNAVHRHQRLHERIDTIASSFETSSFNTILGNGSYGIIAAGMVHTKLMDVLNDVDLSELSILKLGTIWPLPKKMLTGFLQTVEQVLILEENEPFLETMIKSMVYDTGIRIPLRGKQDKVVSREGELFRWQISEALSTFWPGFRPAQIFSPDDEIKYMPSEAGLPGNCPYTPLFNILNELSDTAGLTPVYVVDPGCAIKINTPPFEMLDIKYSMGSSIGIASGLILSGVTDPVIAVVGDSDFFHLGANALFNVAHQGSDLLILILDNSTTALSGFQSSPNSEGVEMGLSMTALDIDQIVRACGVSFSDSIDPWDTLESRATLKTALLGSGVRVIISKSPCPYIETGFCPGYTSEEKDSFETH
jgi:indolepyruvate ferredoxin oxidoreductase, alpha subunit